VGIRPDCKNYEAKYGHLTAKIFEDTRVIKGISKERQFEL
jgi:hypothetical protein